MGSWNTAETDKPLTRADAGGSASRRPLVGARQTRRGSAPRNGPKTITVKNGGSVTLGADEKDWMQLEVDTADRTVALGVILTADEAVTLGLQLLRPAGGPEPFG